jgi:hypothetical protein
VLIAKSVAAFHGERSLLFSSIEKAAGGHHAPFKFGFMMNSYRDVNETLSSPDQPRGPYFATSKVPKECFGEDTLLFLSTGPAHSQIRKILFDVVPAFSIEVGSDLELDFGDDSAFKDGFGDSIPKYDDIDLVLKRTLIRSIFKHTFGAHIDAEGLQAFLEYDKWGASCVAGEDFHKLTFGYILSKLTDIRQGVIQVVPLSAADSRARFFRRMQIPGLGNVI